MTKEGGGPESLLMGVSCHCLRVECTSGKWGASGLSPYKRAILDKRATMSVGATVSF